MTWLELFGFLPNSGNESQEALFVMMLIATILLLVFRQEVKAALARLTGEDR